LYSKSGCLNINSLTTSYLNEPNCTTLKSEQDSNSLYIILIAQPNCLSNIVPPNDSWKIVLIIIGSVVGVALIFVLIVLIVPPLRHKIFPFEKKRYKRNKDKMGMAVFKDKMELKNEIKDLKEQNQNLDILKIF